MATLDRPGNRRKFWMTATSLALLAIGAGLLLYYGKWRIDATRGHQQGLDAFAEAHAEAALPEPATEPAVAVVSTTVAPEPRNPGVVDFKAEPDKKDWSSKRIADYEALRKNGELDALPEAVLRIPSVKLELPVYDGAAEVNLTRGAGVIEGTAPLGTEGNTGLAGHRDGYFRSLKDVKIGDEIQIQMLDADYRYRISRILIVDPEDVHVLDPSRNSILTLVTCYPFYFVGSAPQRYIVRAERI